MPFRHELLCALGGVAAGFSLSYLLHRLRHVSGAGKKVAIVLSGCGVYDGSEIHEAVSVLIHLQGAGAAVSFFALDEDQLHVINHATGEQWLAPPLGRRNQLVESARIARGNIQALTKLTAADFDAVVFPGGFGAAKNLSDFAVASGVVTVHKEVQRVIDEFVAAHKPLGFTCIAPVIAARAIPGCTVTVGRADDPAVWPYGGTVEALKGMDAKVELKSVQQVSVDAEHKVVTTPAYMCNTDAFQVFRGIGNLVREVLRLA